MPTSLSIRNEPPNTGGFFVAAQNCGFESLPTQAQATSTHTSKKSRFTARFAEHTRAVDDHISTRIRRLTRKGETV
jgi:hypothetical protein